MTSTLRHRRLTANGIKIHYVDSGTGPPVILLHGFPFMWYAWRHQIPVSSAGCRLVVPDLRGYGATDRPLTGYDNRSMALDVKSLMDALDIRRAAIIGHDRGARVATRFAKDFPAATARFAALDFIPTRLIFEGMNAAVAQASWFFLFQGVRDLPESLIAGREEIWLRYFLANWAYNPDCYSDTDISVYVHAFSQPGGLRGAFEDYRAWRTDLADDQADKDARISCHTLALWGRDFEVAKMVDMELIWRDFVENLQVAPIADSGHMPHEEQPAAVNQCLLDFLTPWEG